MAGAIAGLWVGAAAAQGTGITLPIERPILTPGIRASATYSDNVLLSDGNRSGDVVVEASPYITAQSFAPRARYNLFYQLRNFWRVRDGDTNFFRHALNGTGSFALVDDRLWLDLSGYMGTISASATGPVTIDPAASFTNTANVRTFTISPWYRDRLGNAATYQMRYALTHAAGNSSFSVAKLHHVASGSVDGVERPLSPWNWRVHGFFDRREFDGGIELNRRQSGVMVFYRVDPTLRVNGTYDYEQIDEVRVDGDNFGYGPGAGFDWTPNSRTTVAASVSRRYYGTIGNARAAYSTPRSTTGIQFSRAIVTSAGSSLLTLDPLALTSTTGTPSSSVLSSLIASGVVLPVGTTLTQSLFTDAAVFDRRVTAFWGLHGARNSLAFSAYASTRESTTELVSTTAVSGIRGSSVAGGVFTGELRERGAAATYQHRLDARSAIDVTLDRRNTKSSTASFDTRLTTLRAGYTTQLTSDTTAFAGYRHTRQSGSGGSASYDENAIYGGVDMRFR